MLVRRKGEGEDDLYALKSIHKEHVIRSRKVRQTKAERNIMTQIRHPFLMFLHWAFQSDGKLYLVMDYLPGGDLFYHLVREKRFTE